MRHQCNCEDAFSGDKIGLFVVEEGNQHYVVVDSLALCSIDTSLLLAYPGRWPNTSYMVPNGVRRIAASAFCGNAMLRSVTLPEGLREIGALAFGRNLTGLHIPASVCRIEGSLRDTASARFALTIDPRNSHYKLEGNSLMSYDGDTLLMMLGPSGVVEVPSGVRVIGECAFSMVDGVTRYVLPEGLTDIGYMAFRSTTAEVELPTTLRTIGGYAFVDATHLRRISIPSVRSIGDYAFMNSSLQEVSDAFNLQTIGDYAFAITQLNAMHFGDSLRLIGQFAFTSVKIRGNITLRSHLQGIGMAAFTMGGLKKVTMLGKVDTLGYHAFRCKVAQLCDSVVPVSYGVCFFVCDSVYTPCGMVREFEEAIEHEEGTAFAEWCGEVEGIGEAEGMEDMLLYPNPARESVVLRGLPESGAEVTVRDLVGRVVLRERLQGTAALIDTRRLAGGVYLLTAATEGGCRTLRLVVE